MDLLVQYWDKKRQGGESKIWDAKFIGHATARDIKILWKQEQKYTTLY